MRFIHIMRGIWIIDGFSLPKVPKKVRFGNGFDEIRYQK